MTTAYFDTSAIVPLIVEEAGSNKAKCLWRDAERVTSARVVYAEGHAALAAAARLGRLPADRLCAAIGELVDRYEELHLVEISDRLVRRAGALAEQHTLRGYDSIHLAAAELSRGDDAFVFVAGDRDLCAAAERIGLEVVRTG
ncbi:MAG: type II toxin-antitoxin system VapC family toxin [Actinomycetota bacterium]|nr:type II toxin-antitoxin system VapC family toxin [Actinomycetota bacterium]